MTRLLLLCAVLLGLSACTSGPSGEPQSGSAWYESGDVNYDALKRATDACKAKGGDYRLKTGGDPTHLGDYECVNAKGH